MHPLERNPPDCSACHTLAACLAKDLGAIDLERFSRRVRTALVWPGTDAVLFDHDDPFDCVYTVREGCVKTYVVDVTGHEQVLGFRWPGEVFGFEGVLNGRYPYSAMAVVPSEVCVLGYDAIREAMWRFPEVNRNVFSRTVAQVSQLNEQDRRPPARRFAAFLLEAADRIRAAGSAVGSLMRLPMRWTEVASYLGMSPRDLRRLLARFERRRLTLVRGQEFLLLDRDRLAEMRDGKLHRRPPSSELVYIAQSV